MWIKRKMNYERTQSPFTPSRSTLTLSNGVQLPCGSASSLEHAGIPVLARCWRWSTPKPTFHQGGKGGLGKQSDLQSHDQNQVHGEPALAPTNHTCLKAAMVFPSRRQSLMTQQWSKMEVPFSVGWWGGGTRVNLLWTCRTAGVGKATAEPASGATWLLVTAYFEFRGTSSKPHFFIVPTNHLLWWLWHNISGD